MQQNDNRKGAKWNSNDVCDTIANNRKKPKRINKTYFVLYLFYF